MQWKKARNAPSRFALRDIRIRLEVQQDLLQFVLADGDARQVRIDLGFHGNAQLAQVVFAKLDDVAQGGLEIGSASRGIILARKTQQAIHDAFHAMRFVPQFLQALHDLLALNLLGEQFRIANDSGERVV